MLSDIDTDKVTNKEALKLYLDLIKAKKLIRLMQNEYVIAHSEVFYIKAPGLADNAARHDH